MGNSSYLLYTVQTIRYSYVYCHCGCVSYCPACLIIYNLRTIKDKVPGYSGAWLEHSIAFSGQFSVKCTRVYDYNTSVVVTLLLLSLRYQTQQSYTWGTGYLSLNNSKTLLLTYLIGQFQWDNKLTRCLVMWYVGIILNPSHYFVDVWNRIPASDVSRFHRNSPG